MKKFLALLFVCAGLTAMAGVPQLNRTNVGHSNMVMKGNTLSKQLMAPATKQLQGQMSVYDFMQQHNVTPNDNRLNKRAPMRVSADDVNGQKIAFFRCWDWSFNADYSVNVDSAAKFYVGGWNVTLTANDDNTVSTDGLYYVFPQDFIMDYDAKTVTMEGGICVYEYTNTKTTTMYTYDTTEYAYVMNEEWLTEDAAVADIVGELFEDGSIYFKDGFMYYFEEYTSKKNNFNGKIEYDTAYSLSNIFRNTYFLTANGEHSYTVRYDNEYPQYPDEDGSNPVYMYQYDDSTVVVWNVCGMGMPGNVMYIYEDGEMLYPYQGIYDYGMSGSVDIGTFGNVSVGWDFTGDSILWDDAMMGNLGAVTPTEITWGPTLLYASETGYNLIAIWDNNKLTFTNGDMFLLGKSAKPTINVTEGDDAYVFTAVGAEGATVELYFYDEENQELVLVDNPLTVTRGDADITLILVAYAQEPGKNLSEPFMNQYVVPAKAGNYELGDVNGDGEIDVQDVTALIDAVLSGNFDNIIVEAADCHVDGGLDVQDVTALIDRVLTGAWVE